MPGTAAPAPAPASKSLKYPLISEWIDYCDRHPDRRGANLSALMPKFDDLGFRYINQLTGTRVTIDKLSEWLSVGPGTADLVIGFAEEDCQLILAGKFTMELAGGLAATAA
jgi:hypothetical protein